MVVHFSRQQCHSLLNVGQDLRLKAGADLLQRINKPGHFVRSDPAVQRKPIEPGHFPPARGHLLCRRDGWARPLDRTCSRPMRGSASSPCRSARPSICPGRSGASPSNRSSSGSPPSGRRSGWSVRMRACHRHGPTERNSREALGWQKLDAGLPFPQLPSLSSYPPHQLSRPSP